MNTTHHIPKIIIGTGIAALFISIFANMQFYASLGQSPVGVTLYTLAGTVLTIVAVLLLPVAKWLYDQPGHMGAALFFGALFLILMALNITAELGYFAKEQSAKEAQRIADSTPAILAEKRMIAASENREAAKAFAELNPQALLSQISGARQAEETLQAQLEACPKNHKTNCIIPKTQALQEAQAQTAALKAKLAEAQGFQAADAEYQAALAAMETVGKPGNPEGIAPVYLWVQELTGIKAHSVQVFLTAVLVIVLELWASLAAYLIAIMVPSAYEPKTQRPEKAPAPVFSSTMTLDAWAKRQLAPLNEKAQGFVGFLQPGNLTSNRTHRRADVTSGTSKPVIVTSGNVTRVPLNLSGKPGKGRVGLWDACPVCKKEFQVAKHNHVFCSLDCGAKNAGYESHAQRMAAYSKSKGA